MKTFANMHVLLLKGGDGSEREVSLKTAKECAKAIKKIGCKITEVDISETNIPSLAKINADVCFNALHGTYGEDGTIQNILDKLSFRYTHSSAKSSGIGFDKELTKKIIDKTEILTPEYLVINYLELNEKNLYEIFNKFKSFVIKPISSGSSFGVKIFQSEKDIKLFVSNLENNLKLFVSFFFELFPKSPWLHL